MDANRPSISLEEQFKIMANTVPVMIWISGIDKLCCFFNAGWLSFTGRTLDEEYGDGWIASVHPDDLQYCLKTYSSSFDARKDFKMEYRLKRYDGQYRLILDHGVPRYESDGSFAGYIGSCVDIGEVLTSERIQNKYIIADTLLNEQRLNEELSAANEELAAANEELMASQDNLHQHMDVLEESESRFRSLIGQAPVGICIIRAKDLMIQEVNDAYLELVGRQRHEMEHLTIWQAIPEAASIYGPIMNEAIRSGKSFIAKEHELVLIRKGMPEDVFVDFVYEPVTNSEGIVTTIMVLGIEITDKVIARRNIADVEERIRLAVEAAEIGTFDHDLLSNEMVTSERFDAIFGFDHQVSRAEFLSVVHPDDRESVTKAREQSYKTGKMLYDTRLIHHDSSIHWIRVYGKVYHDSAQRPVRVLGTVLDITEFKNLQQQKDDFISIASHELKTPITSLKASLQLLERFKKQPDAPLVPKLIEQSSKSMVKISELVEDLLNVSRMSEGQIQLNKNSFYISDLLENCCNHVRATGTHELLFKGNKKLQVFADEQRIDQVVVNFVNNAVKYAPDSKSVHILVKKQRNMVWIGVKDFGPGVPPGKLPHLFDRYYRADSSGFQMSGLGLGLYISAEIIKRHDGRIGVESTLGEGSTFWFTLPLEG